MLNKLGEAKAKVLKVVPNFPRHLLVLGSGLNSVLDEMTIESELSFGDIPHFQASTVQGHQGKLVVGSLRGSRIACMRGRLHYYEGYSLTDVVFPFRVFAACGAEEFFLTNAAGSLRPDCPAGSLVMITDHINFLAHNPLRGPNEEKLGTRFPDMTEVYAKDLRLKLRQTATELGIDLREGIYLANSGPSFETPAEVRMYRMLGADLVGMSTVPEAIALRHLGKKVVAVSCASNLAAGLSDAPLSHEEVMVAGKMVEKKFRDLVAGYYARTLK